MFIDVVEQFADEITQGRTAAASDVSLLHDDGLHDGAERILVGVGHGETAQREIGLVGVLLHHGFHVLSFLIAKVEHAVEADAVQV